MPGDHATSATAPELASPGDHRALEAEIEALRREIERLRAGSSRDRGLLTAMLEHSPHGIIVCDAQGQLILQNRAAERIWAGSATASDVQGWGRYRAFHPDGRPYEPGDWAMARCLTDRETVTAEEVRFQRFDDSRGYLLGSAAPILDDEGRVVGALSVFADITPFKEAERRLRAHHEVARILTDAEGYAEVIPAILAAVGAALEWKFGAYWAVDEAADQLACASVWAADPGLAGFVRASRAMRFVRGTGLPGRVWEDGGVHWIEDVTRDANFPRARAAREVGLGAAFGFPVKIAGQTFGVIEFFSDRIQAPDRDMLALATTVGSQIGQFIRRTRAQDAVRRSEGLKTAILEASLDCVITIDEDGRIEEFNPAAERTFGFRREEVLGRPLAEVVVPPALRDAHRAGLERAVRTGEGRLLGRRIEIDGLRADGTTVPVELAIAPIRIGDRRLFTAFLRDISERSREALRREFMAEASELLSSTLEYREVLARLARVAVPRVADWCAVDVLGPGGEIQRLAVQHTDPAKVQLAAELLRRYPPDPRATTGIPQVLRTGETQFMARIPDELLTHVARDSEHLAILRSLGLRSLVIVPLKARGRTLGAFTLVHAESGREYRDEDVRLAEDLARRASLFLDNALLYHEAQAKAAALEEERQRLEVLNRIGRTLSAELDLGRLVQAVIEASRALSGAEVGVLFHEVVEGPGKNQLVQTSSGGPPQALARLADLRAHPLLSPALSGAGAVRVDDLRAHPGLEALPLASGLAVPVVSRFGKPIGVLLLGHAQPGVFSERAEKLVVGLAAQAAVAIDNASLFHQAQQLIEALERSNRDLDQFAYVTSHDLKAPLRGIANLAHWLEEDLGGAVAEQAKKHLDLLRGRVHRMEALIQGILAYSRAGRGADKREAVSVGKLVHEVVELLHPPPAARVEIAPDLPDLLTERVPLQQVFGNLIGNAIKHARRPDPTVKIEAVERGDHYQFSVQDDGPGIPAEFHDRIFGIFQTLESRDEVESTGIGLAIVRKIVERRGGRVWVESAPGRGATFHFTWSK